VLAGYNFRCCGVKHEAYLEVGFRTAGGVDRRAGAGLLPEIRAGARVGHRGPDPAARGGGQYATRRRSAGLACPPVGGIAITPRPRLNPLRRLLWRGYVSSAAKAHELRYLFWECTLRCNLSCAHCGSACAPNAALPGELTTAEIKDCLSTVAQDFPAGKVMLAVTGGEPLLRPDLFEVMDHATRLGFPWGMVTNATLLNDRAVELCRRTHLGSVSVSLDGLKQHHERLRGRNTFERTLAGIERLRRAAIVQVLEVTTCPTPQLVAQLDSVYEFMCSLGLDAWRIIPIAPIGRARETPELRLGAADWRALLEWLAAKRADSNAPLQVTLDEEGFLGWGWECRVRDLAYYCPAGVNVASILADGAVGACPSIPRSFTQGNIRERRFKDIWEGGFQLLRDRRWMRRGACAQCASFGDCRGNSLHLWDSPDAPGPALCHKKLLE
jgi:radical SAM protein with 4Fe4S-binding SPASM domain